MQEDVEPDLLSDRRLLTARGPRMGDKVWPELVFLGRLVRHPAGRSGIECFQPMSPF
jgi:hypothetical protein